MCAEEDLLNPRSREIEADYDNPPVATDETSGQEEMGFESSADVLVFDEDEDDLEIEIGDLVTFAPEDAPDQEMQTRVTAKQTDPAMGLVAHNTPLGAVLMGATVGETIVLRVPGRPPQSFRIKAIKRDDLT